MKDHLKYRYGLTFAQWDRLFEGQDKRCAICKSLDPGRGKSKWQTDHCHTTGKIRGILCKHCNILLGHSRDRVSVLEAAIEYLKR